MLPDEIFRRMIMASSVSPKVDINWIPHLVFDHFSKIGPVTHDVSHSKKNKKLVALELDTVVFCRWRDFAARIDPKTAFDKFPEAVEITTNSVEILKQALSETQ